MPESTLIVLLLVLLFAIVLAAIAFVLRTLQSIQHTLATIPSAQLASGLNSVHSKQARLAQELGRTANAIGVLQNTQHSVDAAVRTLANQAVVRAESDAQSRELLERLELVIAGSFHRGAAGKNLLSEILGILPPGMLERDVRVNGGVVESLSNRFEGARRSSPRAPDERGRPRAARCDGPRARALRRHEGRGGDEVPGSRAHVADRRRRHA